MLDMVRQVALTCAARGIPASRREGDQEMSALIAMSRGGRGGGGKSGGGKGGGGRNGGAGRPANAPSTTGNRSGGGRGNNPPAPKR